MSAYKTKEEHCRLSLGTHGSCVDNNRRVFIRSSTSEIRLFPIENVDRLLEERVIRSTD